MSRYTPYTIPQIFIFICFTTSCSKLDVGYTPIASMNIINAIVAGNNVKINSNIYDSARSYNAQIFNVRAGNTKLSLYATNDPSLIYHDGTVEVEQNHLYSFFLFGQAPNYETLLVQDQIPVPYSDSVAGIRLINLSPNSNPLNLTVAADTKVNIFSGITYKQLTDFVQIPLPGNVTSSAVTFQVRDGSTNNVLASYTLPNSANSTYRNISIARSRFMNLTLVVRGLQGTTSGTSAMGLFPVANY